MRFLHCSDLHLDSRMESNLSSAQARERNTEVCMTFSRMVDYAAEHHVTGVLIAGDLFDTARVSVQTVDFVLSRIRSVPEVDFLYLRGNHDEGEDVLRGRQLPENFKTFTEEWTYYRYGNVVVAGLELSRGNCTACYGELDLGQEDVNIVMLHGQVSTRPGQEQVAIPRLRQKHVDYLALGHIHSYQCAPLDEQSEYCYCGCLEGRGFDECGEKGFVELTVRENRVEHAFVPFAQRKLFELPVDITGLITVSELQQAMEVCCAHISRDDLVKFTLTGTYTLDTQKDLAFLQKIFASRFYFVKIKDESRLEIHREVYEHDISLKGEFIRMVLSSDKTEEEKEQIICCGIQALSGEEVRF